MKIKSNYEIFDSINSLKFKKKSFVIYDKNILLFYPEIKNWLKKQDLVYGVDSGENLKEVEYFAEHLKNIQTVSGGKLNKSWQIVALGGGSVGDFAGFVASIWKRGIKLIQVPSTWLSSVDSAHGGKNALNILGIKNQIGTFHFPEKIYLVRELLDSQPLERKRDAYGEIIKMAMIGKGKLFEDLNDSKNIWAHIEKAIKYKYKIVKKDPFEQKGQRFYLNFGHTMGHVVEVLTHLSHGRAVIQGIWFALGWSLKERFISRVEFNRCAQKLLQFGFKPIVKSKTFRAFSAVQFENLLREDKKITNKKLNFVFLKAVGKPFCEQVTVEEIKREAIRQGWVQATKPNVKKILARKALTLSKMQ